MSDTKKKSFVFYIEWQEVLMEYPAEVRLEVYDAIIEYVASGTLSELKPLAKMAFSFIKKQIDSNNDKYNSLVEKDVYKRQVYYLYVLYIIGHAPYLEEQDYL